MKGIDHLISAFVFPYEKLLLVKNFRLKTLLFFTVSGTIGCTIENYRASAAEAEATAPKIIKPAIIKPATRALSPQSSVSRSETTSKTKSTQLPLPSDRLPPTESSPLSASALPSFKDFKVDPSSLPLPALNRSEAKLELSENPLEIEIPDGIHVPRARSRRARLLIRNLRNISTEVKTDVGFYGTIPSLRYHRCVPKRDAIAWQQHLKTKVSPKGKPTHGFSFVSSLFGKRPNPFGKGIEFHNGIDLVGAKGTPILATASGRILARSRGKGYGIHVIIDHGSGYQTLYAHLSKKRVKPHQFVKRGHIIGYLGSTGRSTGPHLHYSIYLNRVAVDPNPYVFK